MTNLATAWVTSTVVCNNMQVGVCFMYLVMKYSVHKRFLVVWIVIIVLYRMFVITLCTNVPIYIYEITKLAQQCRFTPQHVIFLNVHDIPGVPNTLAKLAICYCTLHFRYWIQ